MTREEIIVQLKQNSDKVIAFVEPIPEDELKKASQGKWNTLEHVDHLLRCVQSLNKALRIPLPGLKILFGKTDRKGRSFEELRIDYDECIEAGGKAVGRYIPSKKQKKDQLIKKYKEQNKSLNKVINNWKEEDLDKYLLPHPLLKKLTIREMLYFTIFHTDIHYGIIGSLKM